MGEVEQWSLEDPRLPENLHTIRDVFLPKSTIHENETLHEYYTRKGYKCFCNNCRKAKQSKLL